MTNMALPLPYFRKTAAVNDKQTSSLDNPTDVFGSAISWTQGLGIYTFRRDEKHSTCNDKAEIYSRIIGNVRYAKSSRHR